MEEGASSSSGEDSDELINNNGRVEEKRRERVVSKGSQLYSGAVKQGMKKNNIRGKNIDWMNASNGKCLSL
ncbi:Hypothetical protein FKW44_002684 [Caligus rogercresseyi]|uniref:Uncharacterized protein n=1 Tax=Caligus rogercresseyi TaxID=217165 RepID=A0A7T8QWG8_CALRO|nr:Hypothetical protein FKW44_002684 [Caligus rogercresseyi]